MSAQKIAAYVRHHFFTRAFLLFLVIGCINTFDCTLFAKVLIYFGLAANLAFNVGYLLSNIIAYWLNSVFVFYSELSLSRYIKFFLSYVPNYIIQNIIVFIFYNLIGVPDFVSFLIAAVLGIPVTFLLVKIFAFGQH